MSKKVCLISGGLSIGGQERQMVVLANCLANRGYDVLIINLFKTEIEFELNHKIKVVFPDLDRINSHKIIYALRLVKYIRDNIKVHQSESMICFGDWYNAYAILATLGLQVRKIILNLMGPNLYWGKTIEFLNKILYRFADLMVVQTLRAKKIIEKKYALKEIKIIPNPVETVGYNRNQLKKNIITVGRLSREKGHEILINAFSLLEGKDWMLHIVGDGKENVKLKNLVMLLNLEEKVIFHGKLKDFKHLLSESDIFVLPSFYEGFPNALLEAMSAGLCCVASDCVAGPSELIKDYYSGRLFQPGNCEELSKILNELILDRQLRDRMAKNAFDSLAPYEKNNIVDQFEKILFTNEIVSN